MGANQVSGEGVRPGLQYRPEAYASVNHQADPGVYQGSEGGVLQWVRGCGLTNRQVQVSAKCPTRWPFPTGRVSTKRSVLQRVRGMWSSKGGVPPNRQVRVSTKYPREVSVRERCPFPTGRSKCLKREVSFQGSERSGLPREVPWCDTHNCGLWRVLQKL